MVVRVKYLIIEDENAGYYETLDHIICDSMEEADEWVKAHYTEKERKWIFLHEIGVYDKYREG